MHRRCRPGRASTLHAGEILGARRPARRRAGERRPRAVRHRARHGRRDRAGRQPVDTRTPGRAIASGLGFVAARPRRRSRSRRASACARTCSSTPALRGRRAVRRSRPRGRGGRGRARSAPTSACRPTRPRPAIETLSGGNQQKVVMARWMRIGGGVLVLEDPTAGVDVGAKAEIYRLLADALAQGAACSSISTDFEEVAAICHRALVFRDGEILAEIAAADSHRRGAHARRLSHAATARPHAPANRGASSMNSIKSTALEPTARRTAGPQRRPAGLARCSGLRPADLHRGAGRSCSRSCCRTPSRRC